MLTKGEKTGLIGAGIAGALGLGFYGLYQVTTASGTVTACKNTYNQLSQTTPFSRSSSRKYRQYRR